MSFLLGLDLIAAVVLLGVLILWVWAMDGWALVWSLSFVVMLFVVLNDAWENLHRLREPT